MVAFLRDITERKRTQEALRWSETELRAILESTADGILAMDNHGKVIRANRRFAVLWWIPPPLLASGDDRALLDCLRDRLCDPEAFLTKMQALCGSVALEMDTLTCKDGRVFEYFTGPTLLEGVILGRVWSFRDITERKRAEEALRESERRLTEAQRIGRIGNWEWIPAEDKVIWSPEMYAIFGIAPETGSLTTERSIQAFHPGDRAMVAEATRKTLEELKPQPVECRILKPDGTLGYVYGRGEVVLDANGKLVKMVGIYQDITERKRAEEKMQMFSQEIIAAREEERKQVSSVLHHDVGSLAVGISAHLGAVEEELRSGKPGEALKWMKRTRKLFNTSVVRLKKLAIELRPPELDVLGLHAALRQHFAQVTERGGTRIHFRETLGRRRVSGDTATILFRVAQEALTNAITHGHATRVDVGLSASKKEVRLTVRNNGKAFDPSGNKTARGTSHLGLRVMQEMAASAGGAFTIDSGRGKRTTVRVCLPLKTAVLGPGDVTVREETVARGKKTRSAGRGSRPQKGSGA